MNNLVPKKGVRSGRALPTAMGGVSFSLEIPQHFSYMCSPNLHKVLKSENVACILANVHVGHSRSKTNLEVF